MKKPILIALVLAYLVALTLSLLNAIKPGPAFFNIVPRTVGLVVFSVLLYGLLRLLSFEIHARHWRKRNPAQRAETPSNYLQQLKRSFLDLYTQTRQPWRHRLPAWGKLLVLTAGAAYALILWEWIFHVTKVSFLDSLGLGQKLATFLVSGLSLALVALAITLALLLIERLLHPLRLAWLASCLNTAIPAALLTSLVVLWVDSFTYTIFHFGILTTHGFLRMLYGIGIVLLFLELYRRLIKAQQVSEAAHRTSARFKWLRRSMLAILAGSVVLALVQLQPQSAQASQATDPDPATQSLPNIILIGGDGLSASHMSLYGYRRATTPNLDALAETSLVAENAFPNASKTYGAMISLLTSKMPSTTGIIFPPDILHGTDSDEHLPGMLKDLGYTTAQIGVDEYVDANTWNIRNAFDWVNQHTVEGNLLVKTLQRLGYESPAYFIFTIEGRLLDRIPHALFIQTVANPFSTVVGAAQWSGDSRRIDDLLNLLDSSSEPLFVHVHLLESHGPRYDPAIREFSAGQEQINKWMTDFYDDTILSFDAYLERLIEALKASGQFERTLLIVYSDHAMGFQTTERVPLLIHFPAEQHTGTIQTNVQNLDIAPTILDYLDVPVPEWMEGESILNFSTELRQPIFAVRMNTGTQIKYPSTNTTHFSSENYQFGVLQVMVCQRVYYFDLVAQQTKLIVPNRYVNPCKTDSLPSWDEMHQVAAQYLTDHGFDPSILPSPPSP